MFDSEPCNCHENLRIFVCKINIILKKKKQLTVKICQYLFYPDSSQLNQWNWFNWTNWFDDNFTKTNSDDVVSYFSYHTENKVCTIHIYAHYCKRNAGCDALCQVLFPYDAVHASFVVHTYIDIILKWNICIDREQKRVIIWMPFLRSTLMIFPTKGTEFVWIPDEQSLNITHIVCICICVCIWICICCLYLYLLFVFVLVFDMNCWHAWFI